MTTGQTTDRRRQPSRNLPLNRASNKTQIWLAIYHDLIVTRAVLATAELLVFLYFFLFGLVRSGYPSVLLPNRFHIVEVDNFSGKLYVGLPTFAVPPLASTRACVGLSPQQRRKSPTLTPSTIESRPSQKSNRSNTSCTSASQQNASIKDH